MTDRLFQLRVKNVMGKMVIIDAFDANRTDPRTGHMFIDVEVRQGGKVIFPRGQLYCAVNRWTPIGGIDAKELCLSLVGMAPGDTDSDYFAGYTPAQLDWARQNGMYISADAARRYCDENGNVKRSKR